MVLGGEPITSQDHGETELQEAWGGMMYPRSHRGRTSTLLTHLQGHRRHPIIGGSSIRLCRNGWEHAPCKPRASPAGQVPWT